MKKILIALSIAFMAFVQPVLAEERGSMEEAQAMALKAAEFFKANGRQAAAEAFQTPGGEWHDRDLYVFALDVHGVTWAHGANPALVGRELLDLADVSGKPFIREFIAIETEGWVDYLLENPVSGEIEMKTSYIVRVSDDELVGVGAYRE